MKKNITLNLRNASLFAVFLSFTFFVTSCSKKDDNSKPKTTISTHTIKDRYAGGYINGKDTTDAYVLVNLTTGDIVPHADSNTTKWDIGFHNSGVFSGTDIILNSNIHGPGSVEGQLVEQSFNDVMEAPENGYAQDSAVETQVMVGSHPVPVDVKNVFTNSPGYTGPPRHVIIPNADETWIIHTNDNHYVKFQFVSLYKGNPGKDNPDFSSSDGVELGYYTFKWTVQKDGSRDFTQH